jgi:hypothetical protein
MTERRLGGAPSYGIAGAGAGAIAGGGGGGAWLGGACGGCARTVSAKSG